jgi:hypothetical protein
MKKIMMILKRKCMQFFIIQFFKVIILIFFAVDLETPPK